jgi:hypothetical protein
LIFFVRRVRKRVKFIGNYDNRLKAICSGEISVFKQVHYSVAYFGCIIFISLVSNGYAGALLKGFALVREYGDVPCVSE